MLWTCPCCDYDRVSWRPQTWTEAQVAAVARTLCEGHTSSVLRGARGFVSLKRGYAADAPIDCPRCRQSFFPGDSLVARPSRAEHRPVLRTHRVAARR